MHYHHQIKKRQQQQDQQQLKLLHYNFVIEQFRLLLRVEDTVH